MRPGKLKTRITINRPTMTQDEYAGNDVTLNLIGTFWAQVTRLSGSRQVQYEAIGWDRPFEVIVRSDVDVSEEDEIIVGLNTLVVQSIERDYWKDRYSRLICNSRYE